MVDVVGTATNVLAGNNPAPDKLNQTAEAALAAALRRTGMDPAEAVARADGIIQGIIRSTGATYEAVSQALLKEVELRSQAGQREIDAAFALTQSQYAVQQRGAEGVTGIALSYRNAANSGGIMWTNFASMLNVLPEGFQQGAFGNLIKQIGQFFGVEDIWKSAKDTVEAGRNMQASGTGNAMAYEGLQRFELSLTSDQLDEIATSVRTDLSMNPQGAPGSPSPQQTAAPAGSISRASFTSSLNLGITDRSIKGQEIAPLTEAFTGIAASGGRADMIDTASEKASLRAAIRLNIGNEAAETRVLRELHLAAPAPALN